MHLLCLLQVTALIHKGAQALAVNDPFGANVNYGTFHNPSSHVRPRFRYWVNDASMNLSIVAEDMRAIGRAGAGGIELLGYYFYGDSENFGGQLQCPLQTDWTVFGFGSSAWKKMTDTVLVTAKEENLIIDLALGPNQGAGVPAPYHDDGLLWDLAGYNITFPISTGFSGIIPAWGSGRFVAAVKGNIISSTSSSSGTRRTLSERSLIDVTHLIKSNGHLGIQPNHDEEGLGVIFVYYLIHSEYREVQSPAKVPVAVPQSPITSYSQNGSWVVDHFSSEGARLIRDFWQHTLLDGQTKRLLREVGNYLWEDSQEYSVSTWWTPRLPEVFRLNRGYSINRYIPLLIGSGSKSSYSGTTYVTDESDGGASHIVDYQQTLTELNAEYLKSLTQWSKELGIQFSAQVVYNMPMDMLANIPYVDGPECETLGFGHNIDSYRQFAGPAHLSGKRVISNEGGAAMGEVYQQTIPEILWSFQRALAGSVNQFVIHGYPNSGNYANTTWPGFTTFAYLFSEMHGPQQPAFSFYSDWLDWLSRNQFIAQTGIPKVDVAFWSKSTSYESVPTVYHPTDLQQAGYTYQYLSPDNFVLPEAYVRDGTFAPKRQAFKALVIRANDTLTPAGVAKLVEYADAGLPVIFSGGLPSKFSGYNPKGGSLAVQSLQRLASRHNNVHVAPYKGLAGTLKSLGILPRTAITANGTWYTYWRQDPISSTHYVYIYNDAAGASFDKAFTVGEISFETTATPFLYNAWSGQVTPISTYQPSKTHVTIPLQLAGNQSIIIGFHQDGGKPLLHAEGTTDGVLWTEKDTHSITFLRSFDRDSRAVRLSNGKSATLAPMRTPAFTLRNWDLVIESWTPPSDLYDVESGPRRTNTSSLHLPVLIPWNEISSHLANVSGLGYYSTTFNWPPASSLGEISGAILDLGPIAHTARVTVNGRVLPPLDVSWARCDIGAFLHHGQNALQVVVSTPLGNVLRTFWDEIQTAGKPATAIVPSPPREAAYGLLNPVRIVPYRKDVFH